MECAPAGAQPGCLQSRAWPGVPLSVQEIRRLLWRIVLAVQQTTQHILAWSHWRRRHQRLAQYYQIPPDLVVKFQLIDIVDVIL
jgi:hypothetical protein